MGRPAGPAAPAHPHPRQYLTWAGIGPAAWAGLGAERLGRRPQRQKDARCSWASRLGGWLASQPAPRLPGAIARGRSSLEGQLARVWEAVRRAHRTPERPLEPGDGSLAGGRAHPIRSDRGGYILDLTYTPSDLFVCL
jgi:hypothetical protein